MNAKYALIIANSEYTDPGLAQLSAPGRDAKELGRVLDSPEICAFDDVVMLLNENSSKVGEAIDYFLSNRKPDDLLVLYFSGHGVRDEFGSLYLAVRNTNRGRLHSTAIKSDFIRELMDHSRSKRQILILDCCNSGAFTQGTKAAVGVSIGTASAFEAGYGRIILTASDSTQYAWEGDEVIGETDNSLFTHFLIEGLDGEADLDGDGQITVDELYDYAYEKVKLTTPKQTPSKFSSKQQGEIVLRENISIEDIKPVPLPAELIHAIENPLPFVREGAIRQLEGILKGRNIGLARTARETLERIAEEDDSRAVSHAARQALDAVRQTEQLAIQKAIEERKTREEEEARRVETQKAEAAEQQVKAEAKLLEAQKIEQERLAYEKAEVESKVMEEASTREADKTTDRSTDWNTILWFTLGWAISGMFAGFLWSEFDGVGGWLIGGVIGGGGGGLITALILRYGKILSEQISTIRCVLVWALAGTLGWWIGWGLLTEAIGAGIGMAIFAIIGLVSTLGMEYILSNWKIIAGITLAWAIGGGIGWSIARGMIFGAGIDHGTGWAIGMAIGWGIGGFVMGWQLLNHNGRKKK